MHQGGRNWNGRIVGGSEPCILLLSRQSMFRLTPGLNRRKSDSSGFATEGPQFLHPHCRRHFIPSGKGLCLSVLVCSMTQTMIECCRTCCRWRFFWVGRWGVIIQAIITLVIQFCSFEADVARKKEEKNR